MPPHPLAIIGDGPASLALFAELRRHVPAAALVVFGGDGPPLARLAGYGRAIGQSAMRSEGDAHLAPREFPGLATLDGLRRRSPLPWLGALLHTYRPPLALLLEHSAALAARTGFLAQRRHSTVACLQRSSGGFTLCGQQGDELGEFCGVALALGHPALAWPPGVEPGLRVHHAYQDPPLRSGEHVVIVGGGMAAAHLWIAALDAGARVTALTRRPQRRQALNVPRCDFTTLGIERYQALGRNERRAFHRQRAGSFPFRLGWELAFARARHADRLTLHAEGVASVEPGEAQVCITTQHDQRIVADRLICATGFSPDMGRHPLIAELVAEAGVELIDGMLPLNDSFTLPPLSSPRHPCAALGTLARWALPATDTFAGMKIAARRLSPLLVAALRAQSGDAAQVFSAVLPGAR